jgi:peptide deformylase
MISDNASGKDTNDKVYMKHRSPQDGLCEYRKERGIRMAIRQIRTIGDEILTKECKPLKEMTPRMEQLIEDMFETMYETNGVGLAAPQVGVLKQIVVIDVDDGNQYVLINPEIIEQSGSQTGSEGCLSVPGKSGTVTRPNHVVVRCLNEEMKEIRIEGDELLARALCHEIDHLHGHLYVELVEGELEDVEAEE